MRLVPHQDWKEISQLFEKHFKSIAPEGVKLEVTTHHGGMPMLPLLTHMAYQAAKKLIR